MYIILAISGCAPLPECIGRQTISDEPLAYDWSIVSSADASDWLFELVYVTTSGAGAIYVTKADPVPGRTVCRAALRYHSHAARDIGCVNSVNVCVVCLSRGCENRFRMCAREIIKM